MKCSMLLNVTLKCVPITVLLFALLFQQHSIGTRKMGIEESNRSDNSLLIPASGPVPATDLNQEITNADLIVVAQIAKVSDATGQVSLVSKQAQPTYDRLRQAELNAIRVIAGKSNSGSLRVFFLEGKVPSRPWLTLTPGQTVLLFLRSTEQAYIPVIPTGDPIQTLREIEPLRSNATKLQAVAHELEQIILTANPVSASNLIIKATEARVELRTDVNLDLLNTSVLQDPIRRTAWIAVALAENKVEALEELPSLFTTPASQPIEVLRGIIVQKIGELRVQAALPQLALLLKNQKVDLARAAAIALRQIHDPVIVPDLIPGLDYPDQEVRYQVVMGLAELYPNVEAGPSFDLYRENEAYYIQKWKQWWQQNRGSPLS
ncbi:MAG: hypothetical protein SFW36_14215 [Leptolyngbyaceae cyanobacterium bins.59]|nr:hypothetical protein [Leptolyngbyaceae cyanobacterium bins.59]